METIIRPTNQAQKSQLHQALLQLSDEDPLIRTRVGDNGALSIQLYGPIQQEVITARLLREFGIETNCQQPSPVYRERPAGIGYAIYKFVPHASNEFWQTVGLRCEPAPLGSGNSFIRQVQFGDLPRAYQQAIEQSALSALQHGLHNLEVTDCVITLTDIDYDAPLSTAGDFRELTAKVVRQALETGGTNIFQPCYRVDVTIPADTLAAVITALTSLTAQIDTMQEQGTLWIVSGEIPVRFFNQFAGALAGLTHDRGQVRCEPGTDRLFRQ